MAILVKPVQRVNPLDKDAAKKWYVTQVTTAQVDKSLIQQKMCNSQLTKESSPICRENPQGCSFQTFFYEKGANS